MGENWHKLTPADEAHLSFLRRQVDNLERLRYSEDAPANISHQLYYAGEELRQFVNGKRRQGYLI